MKDILSSLYDSLLYLFIVCVRYFLMEEKTPFPSFAEDQMNPKHLPEMSDANTEALILSVLQMPLEQAQLTVPGLEKYTLSDLYSLFEKYLHAPPKIKYDNNTKVLTEKDDDFTSEEDFWLLTFSRISKRPTFKVFVEEFGCYIKTHRSFSSISDRILQIGKMTEEQKEAIIEKVALDIANEDVYYLSTVQTEEMKERHLDKSNFFQVRCNYQPEKKRKPSEHINKEIDSLMSEITKLPGFSTIGPMEENDLAILRGENVIYPMRREAILLGRASSLAEVDIDISFDDEKSCVHISRRQAIISFLEDCNFYIENIGTRLFRVNGVQVLPGNMAKIPPFAILDFSDTMFLFIPNLKFVENVKKAMNAKYYNPKKRIK